MAAPRIPLDPEGYYARLGVDPWCAPETITAAYRRKARLVHPDVPGTGDADAFMALKLAYDVLISADRRAAYDRLALQANPREQEPGEIGPMPFPEMATPPTRHPRLQDLPVPVWAGMAVLLLVGVIEVGLHLTSSPLPTRQEAIPATAREVPPASPNELVQTAYGPAPVRLAGTPNFYVVPAATPAMLWRADETRHTLTPWGQLPPFSAVQGLRLFKANGMVEVRVTDTANGFIEAGRLTPGNTAAAARAWCTYNAGPTPANGEVLSHNAQGPAQGHASLSINNRTAQPAVVKVRTADGALAASVFLDPGGEATVEGLPETPALLDFATGEVWSRACHGFAAGMRAQRLPGTVTIGNATRLAIPPDAAVTPIDLSDQAFEQE
jgi:DnaJ domain